MRKGNLGFIVTSRIKLYESALFGLPLSTVNLESSFLQVLVTKCYWHSGPQVDYSLFACEAVRYMVGGCIGGFLLIVVIIIACYRLRVKIRSRIRSRRSGERKIAIPWRYPEMPAVKLYDIYTNQEFKSGIKTTP